jgi:hypothetical protein
MGSFDPGERQFVYDEAFAFEAKGKSQTYGKEKNSIYCSWACVCNAR